MTCTRRPASPIGCSSWRRIRGGSLRTFRSTYHVQSAAKPRSPVCVDISNLCCWRTNLDTIVVDCGPDADADDGSRAGERSAEGQRCAGLDAEHQPYRHY